MIVHEEMDNRKTATCTFESNSVKLNEIIF